MVATAVLLLALTASAAPTREYKAILQTHKDVRPALTSYHLLTTAIQGNLKSLEWDLGWWRQKKTKSIAAEEFRAWTASIGEFRKSSEAVAAVNDPMADIREELADSPEAKEAAADVPDSISEKIEDIRILRGHYDADAARQALRRALGASKELRRDNKLTVNPAQQAILDAATALRKTAEGVRKRIEPSLPHSKKDKTSGDRAGRKRVSKRLALIDEDADALKTEIARLKLFFGLNNLLETFE